MLDPKETLKKIIIIYWTFWWLIALWTDLVGGLAHYGLLMKSWAPDTNLPFLIDALKMYPLPSLAPFLLFICILFGSFLATASFLWVSLSLHHDEAIWMRRADVAFLISLSFWLAFFLADQIIMNYDLEANHMIQGGFQWLTYLVLYLLPCENPKRSSFKA